MCQVRCTEFASQGYTNRESARKYGEHGPGRGFEVFLQAEGGMRDIGVTGVQTCALPICRPEVVHKQVSKDGTRKWLIRFAPGVEAETVYIPDVGRAGALCVSSQVGCTLNCTFCHTGTQALVRNLTTAEIVAQVQVARDDLGEWPSPKEDRKLSNVVFMGMGEPLYNLDHVGRAIDVISDNEGIALSRRRTTVSTSGVVPQLKRLGEETQAMLAISLHAT